MSNTFRQQVVPEKPKVLSEEQIFIYSPIASETNKGIASFETKDFVAPLGRVKLRWPMDMMVERLADPTVRPSLTKVLSDEFEKTTVATKLINPVTGVEYESATAEIKLNRRNRNALARPDLVMLSDDFEAESVNGPAGQSYNRYRIKRSNPLLTPTIVQLDTDDFEVDGGIVNVVWPMAHENASFGLVKIKPNGGLNFDNDNSLQLDAEIVKAYARIKPLYAENDTTYIDLETGLAKRDLDGNTLIKITKAAVGLSNIENKAFADWEYNDFGANMKAYLQAQYDAKLNKSLWDGESGLFRDWDAVLASNGTVRKRLELLGDEDTSLWASIQSLGLFLGFFATQAALETAHPATEALSGHLAFVTATSTYWTVEYNVSVWEWHDTEAEFNFMELKELNPDNLQPNGDIPSVGTSGKWPNSDHVHPRDSSKLDADTIIQVTTNVPGTDDFLIDLINAEVNIPYIRTAQYLHNWKNNVSVFTQSETSNETYWAGTAAEFENIPLSNLPAGALIVVEDDEEYEAGDIVRTDIMDDIGITIPGRDEAFNDQFVVVDSETALLGVPLMLVTYPATENVGERRRLEALSMSYVQAPGQLATVVDTAGGATIGKLVLGNNRLLRTDSYGKVNTSTLNPSNMLFTGTGDTVVQLTSNRVIMSDVANLVKIWSSGIVADRPVVSDGAHGLSVVVLDGSKMVKTNVNGGLENVDWNDANLVKTTNAAEVTELTEGAVVIASVDNLVESWSDGGVENALVVRGATAGSIKLRTHSAPNKLLVTGENGTLRELPFGSVNQMLVSDEEDGPGWVDVPEAFDYLPQTVLTENPTEEEALTFRGLVAVFLQTAPAVVDMRPNCIYYY